MPLRGRLAFVLPGLTRRERRLGGTGGAGSAVLFLAGIASPGGLAPRAPLLVINGADVVEPDLVGIER